METQAIRQDEAAKADPARPGVLSLHIKERSALYAAYMPFLKRGGIFIPTAREFALGDEVFLLLTLMDDPQKFSLQGKVVWLTPAGANNNRAQGVGVEFSDDEASVQAKKKIEELLSGVLNSNRPTHTL